MPHRRIGDLILLLISLFSSTSLRYHGQAAVALRFCGHLPPGPSAPSVGRSPCRKSPCRIPQGRCDRGSWQLEPCRFPRAALSTRNFNSTFNPTLHPLAPFPSLTPSRPLGMECMQRTTGSSGACGGRHQGALCTLAAAPQSMAHGGGRLPSAFPQVKCHPSLALSTPSVPSGATGDAQCSS